MIKALGFGILFAVVSPMPALARDDSVMLNQLLYDLQSNHAPKYGWRETKSMWDGKVGRAANRGWMLQINYSVSPTGREMHCDVIAPSGSSHFDEAVCAKLTREARLTPALGENGKPVRSTGKHEFLLFHSGPRPALLCATGWDDEEQ